MSSQFNTDTGALQQRAAINRSARYDLEEWIFQQISIKESMHVLDIGCGTGKQIFALRPRLSAGSAITGTDLSPDAVNAVNTRAQQEGIRGVSALECSIDDTAGRFDGRRFDLIMSSYAFYYAKDMVRLLKALPGILEAGGEVFICGPGRGTNAEMEAIVSRAGGGAGDAEGTGDFISPDDIGVAAGAYRSCQPARLANTVTFASADQVLNWWRNHNSYDPELDQRVADELAARIRADGSFNLTKNVLGLKFVA